MVAVFNIRVYSDYIKRCNRLADFISVFIGVVYKYFALGSSADLIPVCAHKHALFGSCGSGCLRKDYPVIARLGYPCLFDACAAEHVKVPRVGRNERI